MATLKINGKDMPNESLNICVGCIICGDPVEVSDNEDSIKIEDVKEEEKRNYG